MPQQTLLIHFISDFLRDEELRRRVLVDDEKGALDYGLTQSQVNVMLTFNPDRICCEIRNELLAIGVDLLKKGSEVSGSGSTTDTPYETCMSIQRLMSASAYSSPGLHPRRLYPEEVMANKWCRVTIAGNGFEKLLQVEFRNGNATVRGNITELTADIDLYQRARIELTLPHAGSWEIYMRNPDLATTPWVKCPFALTVK